MGARILLVDDEVTFREAFAQILRADGYECVTAGDAEEGLERLQKSSFDIAVLDIRLPGMDGVELLGKVLEFSPQTLAIMVTAHGTLENAIEAMHKGAVDFFSKPLKFDEALIRIRGLLERQQTAQEIQALRRDVRRAYDFENIVGRSARMQELFEVIRRVASTMASVLITGETGTGKELVARAIHHASAETRTKRFVALNCAAIPDALLESELFGHMKGAFTGATSHKRGLLEVASGGTIFLDEIGEMGLPIQAKLLRAIERKEVVRLGGNETISLRVRVLSSTHRDLERYVVEERFREDLFHRINVVHIRVPPLRERPEDIPLLAEHFVEKCRRELKRQCRGLRPEAMTAFLAYAWKGNVRELANVVERALILGDESEDYIGLEDLPRSFRGLGGDVAPDELKAAMARFESRHLLSVLRATGGDKQAAAARLQIGLSTLYRRVDDLGLRDEVACIGPSSESIP